jgi:thiol-disulfide isomerase/thioredoxin
LHSRNFPFLFSALLLVACNDGPGSQQIELAEGPWRFVFDLKGNPSPIIALVDLNSDSQITFINAEEKIVVKDVRIKGDSIIIRMPFYDTEFIASIADDGRKLTGHWHNYNRGADYKVPFTAAAGSPDRFHGSRGDAAVAEGRWAAHFDPWREEASSAIGLFNAHKNGRITGTFATETGDHRFLEGVVRNDSLLLSGFDGSHIYLFAAGIHGDSLKGRFNSGTHWEEPWVAVKDTTFDLRDPASMTTLIDPQARVQFDLVDLHGKNISSSDPRFANKVLVLQVMGSWCSNCADEAESLNAVFNKYRNEGLEVVALAFEKQPDPDRARKVLRQFSDDVGIDYPVLFAGQAKPEVLAEKLPFIDKIRAYPTTIFISHTGDIRSVHTGNYGPSTGDLYLQQQENVRTLVEQLLKERKQAFAAR